MTDDIITISAGAPPTDLTPGVYEVTLTDISEPRTIYPQTGINAGKEVQLRDWTFALEDGTEVVLKLGVPNPELNTELAALRFYDGQGCVRLLDADEAQGAMLLERLRPGTELITLEDDGQAAAIAAQVIRELWRPLPPNHPFPTVACWGQGFTRLRERFQGGTGPFSPELVARAEGIFAEYLASMAEPVLPHGDLHEVGCWHGRGHGIGVPRRPDRSGVRTPVRL